MQIKQLLTNPKSYREPTLISLFGEWVSPSIFIEENGVEHSVYLYGIDQDKYHPLLPMKCFVLLNEWGLIKQCLPIESK